MARIDLYGGEGHDRLDVDGSLDDYLDGGDGDDTAYFNFTSEVRYTRGFSVDLSSGHFGFLWFGPPSDTPQNIVNIENVSGVGGYRRAPRRWC